MAWEAYTQRNSGLEEWTGRVDQQGGDHNTRLKEGAGTEGSEWGAAWGEEAWGQRTPVS